VLVCAVVTRRTSLVTLPVVALWHLAQIKGVQELAVLALFAQSTKEMLAYQAGDGEG
jgi:hypothetical protein